MSVVERLIAFCKQNQTPQNLTWDLGHGSGIWTINIARPINGVPMCVMWNGKTGGVLPARAKHIRPLAFWDIYNDDLNKTFGSNPKNVALAILEAGSQ